MEMKRKEEKEETCEDKLHGWSLGDRMLNTLAYVLESSNVMNRSLALLNSLLYRSVDTPTREFVLQMKPRELRAWLKLFDIEYAQKNNQQNNSQAGNRSSPGGRHNPKILEYAKDDLISRLCPFERSSSPVQRDVQGQSYPYSEYYSTVFRILDGLGGLKEENESNGHDHGKEFTASDNQNNNIKRGGKLLKSAKCVLEISPLISNSSLLYEMTLKRNILSLFALKLVNYQIVFILDIHSLFTLLSNFLHPIKIFKIKCSRLAHWSLEYKCELNENDKTAMVFFFYLYIYVKSYNYRKLSAKCDNYCNELTDNETCNLVDLCMEPIVDLHRIEVNNASTLSRESDNSKTDTPVGNVEQAFSVASSYKHERQTQQPLPVCKQIYGNVCLKRKETIDTDDLLKVTTNEEEPVEGDKKESDIIKQAINGNLEISDEMTKLVLAPVSKKKQKKRQDENKASRNRSTTEHTEASVTDQSATKGAASDCYSSDSVSKDSSNGSRSERTGNVSSNSNCENRDDTRGEQSESYNRNASGKSTGAASASGSIGKDLSSLVSNDGFKSERIGTASRDSPRAHGACHDKLGPSCSMPISQCDSSLARFYHTEEPNRASPIERNNSPDIDGNSGVLSDKVSNLSRQEPSQISKSVPQNSDASNVVETNQITSVKSNDASLQNEKHSHRSSNSQSRINGDSSSNQSLSNSHDEQRGLTTSSQPTPEPAITREEIQRFEPLMDIIDQIAEGERVPPQITMRYEMLRFCTLRSYPKERKPFITRFAQAGFYYANNGDEVVCYTCARRKQNWREDDIPIDVHRQLSPNCKFLVRNSEVNVPIIANGNVSSLITQLRAGTNTPNAAGTPGGATRQTSHNTSQTTNSDTSETWKLNSNQVTQNSSTSESYLSSMRQQHLAADTTYTNSSSETNNSTREIQNRPQGNFAQTSVNSIPPQQNSGSTISRTFVGPNTGSESVTNAGSTSSQVAKYPNFEDSIVRTTSFVGCTTYPISNESLVEAGFYHAGFGDCVRCFHCGVGLRHWSADDDPWIEHSRWSKDCYFVRRMKGEEFVRLVRLAVEYAQKNNEQNSSQAGNRSSPGASGGDDIETLLHTDSAQSVLEMGYHPDLIRNAISRVLNDTGRQGISAVNIMAKIFEIEEEETGLSEPADSESSRSTEREPSSAVGGSSNLSNESKDNTTRAKVGESVTGSHNKSTTQTSRKMQLLEQRKLKQENKKLREEAKCTICKKVDVCIVFLPCGHLVTCESCAPSVKYCSVSGCGAYIKGTVRTYLS